jgi:carbon storage regulator CsrA
VLVLTLVVNEGIKIGDDITIYNREAQNVSLAFDAPKDVPITRVKSQNIPTPNRKARKP